MFLRHRIEWDYSWLANLPGEVSLCCVYEYCRYALLSIDSSFLCLYGIDPRRILDLMPCFGAATFFWTHYPEGLRFPQMPYRVARKLFAFDPELVLTILEQSSYRFGRKLKVSLPSSDISRQEAEALLAEARNNLPSYERPKRGAGARIRQDKTALRDLGALKLLEVMHAPKAITHTEEFLGKPLFKHESQWSRARQRARANLLLYRGYYRYRFREEAQALYRVMSNPLLRQ